VSRNRLAAALVGLFALNLSCKVSLTPESIGKTWTAIKDARKDLTPENEYYTGRSVATNLLARHDYKYRDQQGFAEGRVDGLTKYVTAVGTVIASAALSKPRDGDRPTPIGGWHFVVVESDTINAFAAPGGWVFVTTAAIRAARTEDQLAAILAHEVAHVVRGHALGSIKKSRWAGVYKEALDSTVELDEKALGDLTKVFDESMNDMIDGALVKGYSRDTEFEADRVGMAIMARAGYDPQAFVHYLNTLSKTQATGSGGFSATHPKASDRIGKLKAELKKYKNIKVPQIRKDRFRSALAEAGLS
jgi:beta-barrel assembly-enhancing protease